MSNFQNATADRAAYPGCDYITILADQLVAIDCRAAIARERQEAKRRRPERARQAFASYAHEVLARIQAWAWLHHQRANARELPSSADAFEDLAMITRTLQQAVEDRGLSDSIVWSAEKSYRAAFRITANWSERGFYHEAAFDQECEAEASAITSLHCTLAVILDRQWQMDEGILDPAEAQLEALEALHQAEAPPGPTEELPA